MKLSTLYFVHGCSLFILVSCISAVFLLTFQTPAFPAENTYWVHFPDADVEEGARDDDENESITELTSLGARVLSIDDESAIVEAPPAVLEKIEKSGFDIEERGERRARSKLQRMGLGSFDFELSAQFPPKVFPGEQIDELQQMDIDDDGEREIIVSTHDGSDTSGSVYVFSPNGTLEGSRSFVGSGVEDIAIHDFDSDDTDEILVRLSNSPTFYVLSHTGADEWSGTVMDNITGYDYNDDLNNDGTDDIIVYSRDLSVPRGQITTFDYAAQAQMGVRQYTAADLSGRYSPYNSLEADLDGDGFIEIIPSPRYLKQKFEVLNYAAAVTVTKSFADNVDGYDVADLNGDGNDDIVVETLPPTDESTLHAYMGYTGSDFGSSWVYPPAGTMKRVEDLGIGDGRVAFGTQDSDSFTGCGLYLLDSATGAEIVPPVPVVGTVDEMEYRDLDGDGDLDLAVLTRVYDGPTDTTTWTIRSYDQSLNLFTASGHFVYSESPSWRYSTSLIRVHDLTNDGFMEIWPLSDLGNELSIANYEGVLKWQYALNEQIEHIKIPMDLDDDGKDDLVVQASDDGVVTHVYTFSDGGTSGILLGSVILPDTVYTIYMHDLNNDGYCEIIPRLNHLMNSYVYTYNFSEEIWSGVLSGDSMRDVNYLYDMDGNGVDDLLFASNDETSNTAYLTLYWGGRLPVPKLAVMKKQGVSDLNLYYYNSLVPGEYTYWDALRRNPAPYCRDLWFVPAGNNAVAMASVSDSGPDDLYVMKKRGEGDLDLFRFSGLVGGDWTFQDNLARNGWPLARDYWIVPRGTDAIGMAAADISVPLDGREELAVLKRQGPIDMNLYYYNTLETGDWRYWDCYARNPSPLARDLWIIPRGNNADGFASFALDDADSKLAIVRREGVNDQNLYVYNNLLPGDWRYWDCYARNPSPLARDLWVIPAGNGASCLAAIDADNDGSDELAVVKEGGPAGFILYYYNAPLPGDWTYWDAIARNPSPLAMDAWSIPSGGEIAAITAARSE